jgi:hypothetical protein
MRSFAFVPTIAPNYSAFSEAESLFNVSRNRAMRYLFFVHLTLIAGSFSTAARSVAIS